MNNLLKLLVMSKDFMVKGIGENQYRVDYISNNHVGYVNAYSAIIKDDTYYIIYSDNDTNETNESNSVERQKALEIKSQLSGIYDTIINYIFDEDQYECLEKLIVFCELIVEDN